eukprot:s8059_g1.t1
MDPVCLLELSHFAYKNGIIVARTRDNDGTRKAAHSRVSDPHGADAGVAFFRTAKTIRLLRFFRLIRLMKARSRINDFVERVQSEASLILIGIAKLIAFIALINHLVACIWYAIGTYDLTREDTWLRTTGLDAKNIWYRYSTALHWSMSQFTPASMEVVPANEYERFFTVCMILCGMLIFSSFVSAITSAMNQLRNLNSWRHEQESLLRRYLQENEVSPSLTARIHNCLQKALQRSRRRVHVDEIRIFQQLPLSLKFELTSEIYSPTLGRHPFFNFCHSCLPSESRKIYSNGVSQKYLVMSQELLTTGEAGKHMYFLQTGTLNYKQENEPEYRTKAEQLWLVEAALWLKWIHVGTAESLTHCELLGLDVGKVQDVLKDEATVATYARKFWKYFSENPGLLSDVWMGDPDDDESPHHWAASAFSRAEEIMGRSIQPEPLSPVFTRFLDRLRRASNGMLRRFSVASIDVDDAGPAVAGPGKLPPQLQAPRTLLRVAALEKQVQDLQRQEADRSRSPTPAGRGASRERSGRSPSQPRSPRDDRDPEEDLEIVIGGWSEARRSDVEHEVRQIFQRLKIEERLQEVIVPIVPYVRVNVCRVYLKFPPNAQNIRAQRAFQTQTLDKLKSTRFLSGVAGSKNNQLWMTKNRTPEERNKIRGLVQTKEFYIHVKYGDDRQREAPEIDWRGRVYVGRVQCLAEASNLPHDADPADVYLSDSRGDHTGWVLLASRFHQITRLPKEELAKLWETGPHLNMGREK